MDWSAFELPPPPDLSDVAAEMYLVGQTIRDELENLFLEISYLLDADFIVDRLIAEAYR